MGAQDPGDLTLGPLQSPKIPLFTGVCLGQDWVQPLLSASTPRPLGMGNKPEGRG